MNDQKTVCQKEKKDEKHTHAAVKLKKKKKEEMRHWTLLVSVTESSAVY